jgi:hypothetical protein
MKEIAKKLWVPVIIAVSFFAFACTKPVVVDNKPAATPTPGIVQTPVPTLAASPAIPDLQKELLDERSKTTSVPIGNFDFRNHSYPLPRGWVDPDGDEAVLSNGERKMTEEKIGLSFVTVKYFDVTGDGRDEALVILKIVTAGSAIPQIAYIYDWKDEKPELIWYFRTGDRADGGLKDVRPDNEELIVELYGQDRFLIGEVETLKVTGDIEQLCCPTYYTRTRYKWNGKNFLMQGKRLTFSVADKDAAPVENLGDTLNDPKNQKK